MKLVKAIIRPFKLEEVKEALMEIGVGGITVIEVQGFGRQKGLLDGVEGLGNFLPKIMIEVVINDEFVAQVTNVISRIAKTSKIGDGKIFVLPVEEVIRIRTNERDEAAV